MKNLRRYFLLLVLILFALQGAASAAVLYVKTDGNDANSGKLGLPRGPCRRP